MITIDLNADLGEGMPWDFEILKRVSSANISCGAHAGEPEQILATLEEAKKLGVVVGAHPGWPDRENFGRVERNVPIEAADDVNTLVILQVQQLKALADSLGVPIRFLKPHGALYNQAMSVDEHSLGVAPGLIAAAAELGLPLMGLPGMGIENQAAEAGVSYIREGFPDRRYGVLGRLLPRNRPDAMIHEPREAVEQALRLIDELAVDSLCLHGDSPTAIDLADALSERFEQEKIVVRSFLDRS